MWLNLIFAGLLIAVSIVMVLHHAGSWSRDQSQVIARSERDFLYRRYRRRMHTSLLIGGIGLLVAGSTWITSTVGVLVYSSMGLLGVVLLVANATFDWKDSRTHYSEQRKSILAERTQLEIQIRNQRAAQEDSPNGHDK